MKAVFFLSNLFLILFNITGISPQTSAQSLDWVKNIGGANADYGNDVAVDNNGNVFVTGYFNSPTANFNPGGTGDTLSTSGGFDVFLAKYDANGNFIWAKKMGGSGADHAYALAIDRSNNVYITGQFSSSIADFNIGGSGGTLTNSGKQDIFLAKYDQNGNFLWAKNIGGTGDDVGYNVAVDQNENVYITGYFASVTVDFNASGNGAILRNLGIYDAFLAKYDPNGNYLWAKNMGGNQLDIGHGIDVDLNGNVYVTGEYNSASADFNLGGIGGILTNYGNYDIFLVKYDSKGNYLWGQNMGGKRADCGYGVAVNNNGNVFVTGYFSSDTANFNKGNPGDELIRIGAQDVFLASYDTLGNHLWSRGMGGISTDIAYALSIDLSSNVYLAGVYTFVANFNPSGNNGAVTAACYDDIFLAKYDKTGNFLWVKSMGGNFTDKGSNVAVYTDGSIYGTGRFASATANFNPGGNGGILNNLGNDDAFIVKFTCGDTSSSYFSNTICESSFTFNNITYSSNGSYRQIFPNKLGCDSIIILDLSFYSLDPVIKVDRFTLSTTISYDSYQWLKNNEPIPGANDGSYLINANGNYKVVVTNDNGCTDTSDSYEVNNYIGSAINGSSIESKELRLYPNPATEIVYVPLPVKVNLRVTDVGGRTLCKANDTNKISIKNLLPGIYYLHVNDGNALVKVLKLVKQ